MMKKAIHYAIGSILCSSIALTGIATADTTKSVVKIDKVGGAAELPQYYPEYWVLAHDAAFFHMMNGHYMVLDPSAETGPEQYKGMIDGSFVSSFAQSKSRNEFYVIETFYSRGSRGVRTDVVTIYDPKTLSPKGEIVLPSDKFRMSSMPEQYASQIINDKFLLIMNMTPATSVTVVDLDSQKVIDTVDIPGCALVYPTGKSSFSSICATGGLATYALDDNGKLLGSKNQKPFFNADQKPVFEKPVIIDNLAYFIGFEGEVYNIDLSADEPKLTGEWSLLSEADKGWRPGGWQLNATDDNGRLYILMHPEGYNGSHKDGGPELWIYEPLKEKRVAKIPLKTWGVSVMATHGKEPYVLVTNAEMQVDVYQNDKYLRTLAPFGQQTPFLIHANEMSKP